jgi:hypothetical protein
VLLEIVKTAAMVVCYEPIRDVGFFLFAAGWFVVMFASSGVIITDSLMIILGADILMRGCGQSMMYKHNTQ